MDSANAASAASSRNKSSLAQRVASAAVLLPIVAGVVWWSVWSVAVVVALATALGLIELYGALRQGGYRPRLSVGLASGLLLIGAIALRPLLGFDPLFLAITLAVIGSLAIELTRSQEPGVLAGWSLTLAGALYIAWLFGHFILLRTLSTPLRGGLLAPQKLGIEPGAAWIYLVLAITWIQDTAAYFVGKNMGRHKMAPLLSPKKTWEGAVGGLIGSVLAGVLCVLLLGLPISLVEGGLLGLVGGVVGPLGDLSESMIKRQVGLKDAGNLIPGHGGILDRTDSLLFTGSVLYYLIRLLAG
jgi:phosphatidate cytidylyltransferase